MMTKNIFKLARLLKLLSEMVTDKGVLVSEGEIEVGAEVFVYDEQNEAVPAPDGEYVVEGGELTVVVANGIVTEIRQMEELPIEQPVDTPAEEASEETSEMAEEEAPAEEMPAEEPAEEIDVEALKAEIEALKAENEELKARIAEYEEKEKEANEPSIEEEDRQQFSANDGLNERQKRAAEILRYRG